MKELNTPWEKESEQWYSTIRNAHLVSLSKVNTEFCCAKARLPSHPRVLVYVTRIFSKEATPVISFPAIPVALLWHQILLWLPSLALLLTVEHVASAAVTSKIIKYYKLPFGHMQWFFKQALHFLYLQKRKGGFQNITKFKVIRSSNCNPSVYICTITAAKRKHPGDVLK